MPHTYFITGANRGIGLEFLRQVRERGDRVIAAVRDPKAAKAAADLGATLVQLEVGDAENIRTLPARLDALGVGAIDILINNAGVSSETTKTIAELSADELQRVFMVNSFSPLLVVQRLLPRLRKGSRRLIVNITSTLGSIANNNGGSSYAYRASKAALNQLSVSLSHELKGEGFCVVPVHPGWVRTDMGGQAAPLSVQQSVGAMISAFDKLNPADTGRYLNYDGSPLPW